MQTAIVLTFTLISLFGFGIDGKTIVSSVSNTNINRNNIKLNFLSSPVHRKPVPLPQKCIVFVPFDDGNKNNLIKGYASTSTSGSVSLLQYPLAFRGKYSLQLPMDSNFKIEIDTPWSAWHEASICFTVS